MKCQSVECLWPATTPPPLHRITVTAVLNQPPALYTGGSDGSIIWWKLSPSITRQQNYQDVWPMAMLCGHAAPIADLDICVPLIDTGEIEDSININSTSIGSEALISVCTDGVLCIWSSHSGHCKRRRKMPPWVGSPTAMISLSSSRRYVCVACSYAHVPNYNTGEIAEAGNTDHIQNETVIERETPSRRTSKGAVVIVDSCTLNIVRTIFHGILSIGPVKSMALLAEDKKDQSVIMADSVGRIQSIAILKESRPEGEGGSGSEKSPRSFVWADVSDDEIQGISIAPHGRLLASIFSNHCTFKSTVNGSNVGEISFADNYLFKGSQTYLSGGMFLEGETNNVTNVLEREHFVVWSNTGAALVCAISGSGDTFSFDLLLEIPNVSHSPHVKVGILFCQLSCYILRMESICSEVECSSLWKPRISIWSFCPVEQSESGKNYDHGDPYLSSMLGEGGFLGDWTWSSFCFPKYEAGLGPTNSNGCCVEHGNDLKLEGRIVSSSLILSEESYTPYAVVYGFYSGEIAVVGLEMFCDGNTNNGIGMHASDRTFLGHMGAILCLAAHRMVATSDQQSPKHLLVSGSMDCTIRIWDLDSGSLVSVMHHHLEPVRQIILPPPWTNHPWNNCFLSVGADACVALVSLETLHVERMFPGHPNYPGMVVWDSARGYIACLCREVSDHSDAVDILYLWDAKTGARERVLRGTASHSMFDHFCKGVNINSVTGNILGGTTSAPSLLLHAIEDMTSIEGISISSAGGKAPRRSNISSDLNGSLSQNSKGKLPFSKPAHELGNQNASGNSSRKQVLPELLQNKKHLIKCSCPTPGVAILKFDLSSLVASIKQDILLIKNDGKDSEKPNVGEKSCSESSSEVQEALIHLPEQNAWASTPEGCLLRFSLPFLHLWGVDTELDTLLVDEMGICRPEKFLVAPGLEGDRGSLTLVFPGLHTTLELWKSSSEFCAMRSLTMVTLAQRMINLTCPTSAASSALAAFYTRNFAERVPDIKPPLLQLLVSFWQDPTEHVRMAARSLFHCAASRAIPLPICNQRTTPRSTNSGFVNFDTAETSPNSLSNLVGAKETQENCLGEESEILDWLESYEMQDWICYIGGTSQDAKASHIIVAGALVVWYPSLVKPSLATSVVHHLVKLVMAMTDKYSATAAELLAEGMECTWKPCIGPEIPHLIRDIFLLIECLNSASTNSTAHHPVTSVTIQEILVGILLPSLAMADIAGFLNIIESQIWATASDSPVHLVSLMTLIRIIRGSPKPLAPYLDKVVDFILQTMDPGNSVMRKACLNSSMVALKEVVRIFSMVALNEASTKLAVGDAIGDIRNLSIKVYDIHSGTKIKVLDASGPPGLPSLLDGASDRMITTAISALSFSPDGEGLVAFSEHGLIIRWWSLGGAWWEKLSRSMIPVQCTKLIFVPPWEGFSPNKSRSSIMASIIGHSSQPNPEEKTRGSPDVDGSKLPIHNLDLSYRLEWGAGRKLALLRHGQELGSFQL